MVTQDEDVRSGMPQERILITGAAGIVGTMMRERLRRPGRLLRLLDVADPGDHGRPDEDVLTGSVNDAALMATACEGIDSVIHLGGISRENSWANILQVNIDGTHTVLDAARQAGVRRVILASSNHAVGFRRLSEAAEGPDGLPADSTARPDTYYGVSKAAMEALGSLYHSRFGMDVTVIRIGSCFPDPLPIGKRGLATWLSPDDAARLFESALATQEPDYRVVWGVSDNTRRVYSLAEARRLGYVSHDDAETYAGQLADAPDASGPAATYVGGGFCTAALGEFNQL
ncbi:NAD-dependent epimerase/dehydratase family protein [Rudaeicoccus suwonensis]|uniref:NAD-dependent epimerase/dehydratase family protein n=1 Tax=Rudaeicoccus suwonensis TaxID=657409 RepID=A0A561EC72_9MICO|nr:NAD(P)-dependent oxidoreductase [Rudaeicoccus suwonensis]TWE13211.1 NAD-dependent epimerase/dehydratase family protein [Rudaeicoccus suwonensis]